MDFFAVFALDPECEATSMLVVMLCCFVFVVSFSLRGSLAEQAILVQ